MKILPAIVFLATASMVSAKPPGSTPKESTKPSATPAPPNAESPADAALARWLGTTPAGLDSLMVPFAPLASAASGKRITAFDPGTPVDAAALAKIGGVLDALLPRMNQPESAAHKAVGPEAVSAAFEGEMRSLLTTLPPAAGVKSEDRAYPRLVYADAGKAYYLAVGLYPTGGDAAAYALGFRPDLAAQRITTDGCCLLVGVEHNGKPGKEAAFLNWQIVDLAKTRWRFIPVFVTGGPDTHSPGTVLTDGRKGRD